MAAVAICLAVLASAVGLPAIWTSADAAPSKVNGAQQDLPPLPAVSADAYMVYDVTDDVILASEQIETKLPIASLTKLMTALLVVEHTEGDESVAISQNAARAGESSGAFLDLGAGEKYTVDDLLVAMLVYSANDAATALAEHVAGSEDSFVELMNERAERMNLDSTKFTSVHGLDAPDTVSTPFDLLELTRTVLKDERISGAVRRKSVNFTAQGKTTSLRNRNPLIGSYDGVDGVKTGFTDEAGYCLIAHYMDEETRAEYLTIALGSGSEADRERDGRVLLDWARSTRPQIMLAESGEHIGEASVAYSDRKVKLFMGDDVAPYLRIGATLQERIVVPARIEAPRQAGDEVGRYQAVVDGEVVAESPVFIESAISRPTTRERAAFYTERLGAAWDEGVDLVGSGAERVLDAVA